MAVNHPLNQTSSCNLFTVMPLIGGVFNQQFDLRRRQDAGNTWRRKSLEFIQSIGQQRRLLHHHVERGHQVPGHDAEVGRKKAGDGHGFFHSFSADMGFELSN